MDKISNGLFIWNRIWIILQFVYVTGTITCTRCNSIDNKIGCRSVTALLGISSNDIEISYRRYSIMKIITFSIVLYSVLLFCYLLNSYWLKYQYFVMWKQNGVSLFLENYVYKFGYTQKFAPLSFSTFKIHLFKVSIFVKFDNIVSLK